MKLSDYLQYPAEFKQEENGAYFVRVKGIDGAFTQGMNYDDAMNMAIDVIRTMGQEMAKKRIPIPVAPSANEGDVLVRLPVNLALKIMLRNAMTKRNFRPVDLAHKMGLTTQQVAQLLDFERKATRIDTLFDAFQALGSEIDIVTK